MAKINKEEYEILKGLGSEWKWIARDNPTDLFAYRDKPEKYGLTESWGDHEDFEFINSDLFSFIQWEDKGPYNIAELIEEYEEGVIECGDCSRDMEGDERVCAYCGWKRFSESEESGLKNIEWLKKEFDEVIEFRKQSNPSSSWDMGSNNALKYIKEDFKNLINQLDEPEVLSEEFGLRKYQEGYEQGRVDRIAELISDESVTINHNPTIPQFVADWIE